MNKNQVTDFLQKMSDTKERNMVVVDFANVDCWKESLGWSVGLKKLGRLMTYFSVGKKFLRKFYYGQDFGPSESSTVLLPRSKKILMDAQYSGFEIITKGVKYIPYYNQGQRFVKKCDLDLEIVLDLIKEQNNYDTAFLFSGDGDFACACYYLHEVLGKYVYVFAARNHLGKELLVAKEEGAVKDILFAEDFDYRLDLRRP